MPDLYLALVHYPVVNKRGETIASAVTNLDLHDIARASKTYGVKAFYVVTPLEDQATLVSRILSHWTEGFGASANPARGQALELIKIAGTLEEVVADIQSRREDSVKIVGTSAREGADTTSFGTMRGLIADGQACLLLFGTAWGLAADVIKTADYVLDPIAGNTGYNHLSVRSAVSIVLDRLVGGRV